HFFVTHVNGEELPVDDPRRRWQDTIGIPPNDNGPGSITCRSRFETFTGKFVIHCHILRHEDLGMMQTVEVIG
ncbi:MAG: multicopper oxidase domain-containing protein, partial [Rhizobiaceae bacterium]|nr:multicopper oxidase domain-containing protein [Hyphomicrobiales bacterium]NRB32791.1 multicopper oxidase domain-containing protein [Rhizobiaceae bacterium]